MAQLREQKPHRLEAASCSLDAAPPRLIVPPVLQLLNRRPPFGSSILSEVAALPHYALRVTEEAVTPSDGSGPVTSTLLVQASLASPIVFGKDRKRTALGFATILTITSDNDFVDFRRLP